MLVQPENTQSSLAMNENLITELPDPFHRVIERLNVANISYAILRPSSSNSTKFQDLDILVDPRHRKEFVTLCGTGGFYESHSNPTLLLKQVFYQYKKGMLLALDVHYAVVSKGLVYLDYKSLLKRRVFRGGVYYLSFEDQLLHLVFHCILDKCHVPIKHDEFVKNNLAGNFDEAYLEDHLEDFGTYSHFKSFLAGQRDFQGHFPECNELREQVRRVLRYRRPGNFMRYYWRRVCHRFKQLIGKRGVLIAVVGPDGVGKSTLTNRLQDRIKELRQSSTCVYMGPWGHTILPVPKLVKFIGAPGTASQRLKIPMIPQIRWGIYLFFLSIEFLARQVFRVIPARRNYSVVFADRYFYDIGAGYKKRAIDGCQRLRQIFCRFLPRPELTLFLLASPRTVASRKKELNDVEVSAFNRAYHAIAQRLGMAIVESDEQIENIVESVLEDIWPLLLCSRKAGKHRVRKLVEASWKKYSMLNPQFSDVISLSNEFED